VLALVLALVAIPTPAHYLRLADELAREDTFTVGVALTGRPFAYREEGRVRGFEISVARAVADAHGLVLRIVQLPRDGLMNALRSGEVDAVNSLALHESMVPDTTVPYLVIGNHVMVLRGNPFRIRDADDLSARTVAATAGSTAEAFASSVNEQLIAAGREPMNIHSFPYQRDTHFPVSMGHAAAYFIQTVSAIGISQDPESRTRLVEGLFNPDREVGLAVSPQHSNVYHAVEHAIAAMVATGKYERLRKEHDLPLELSPYR
jgi:ABC-type amino acid transport substrate-binding protein